MWHDEQSAADFIVCLSIPQKLLAVNNLSLTYAAAFMLLYKYETATPYKVLDVNMLHYVRHCFCHAELCFAFTR